MHWQNPPLSAPPFWMRPQPVGRNCVRSSQAFWPRTRHPATRSIGRRRTSATPLLAGYLSMKQREAQLPPQCKVVMSDALDWLVELYTALNKPADVRKWQAERAKYP